MLASGPEATDCGPWLLDFLFDSLQIEKEWSVRGAREFTWWGHGLAQTVRAEPPEYVLGCWWTRLCAVTHFLADVPDTPEVHAFIELLNTIAAMNAYVWDPDARTIRLACSASIPHLEAEWLARIFLAAVALQVSEAHARVEGLAEILHCRPDVSAHPNNGLRPEPHHILFIMRDFFIPSGQGPSAFVKEDFDAAKEAFDNRLPAIAGDDGLTVEFPFFGVRPAVYLSTLRALNLIDDPPPDNVETALLQVSASERHPVLGSGVLFLLRLPPSSRTAGADRLRRYAYDLNRQAYLATTPEPWGVHQQMGAWVYSEVQDVVACVSFLPSVLRHAGLVTSFAQFELIRARYARLRFDLFDAQH